VISFFSFQVVWLRSREKLLQLRFMGDFEGCGITQAVNMGAIIAAEVILGIMGVVVVAMGVMLWKWRSGVAASPWSIAGMAAMLPREGEVRALLREAEVPAPKRGRLLSSQKQNMKSLVKGLEGKRFGLRYYLEKDTGGSVREAYGLVVVNDVGASSSNSDRGGFGTRSGVLPRRATTALGAIRGEAKGLARCVAQMLQLLPRNLLERAGPLVFAPSLSALFIILVYYETTTHDTPFERFMDGQKFGVRFLFTAIGVIIGLCWKHAFHVGSPFPPNLSFFTTKLTVT